MYTKFSATSSKPTIIQIAKNCTPFCQDSGVPPMLVRLIRSTTQNTRSTIWFSGNTRDELAPVLLNLPLDYVVKKVPLDVTKSAQITGYVSDFNSIEAKAKYTCLKNNEEKTQFTKVLYKTTISIVLAYGSETWALSYKATELLDTFQRKILRRLFGLINKQVQLWTLQAPQWTKTVHTPKTSTPSMDGTCTAN